MKGCLIISSSTISYLVTNLVFDQFIPQSQRYLRRLIIDHGFVNDVVFLDVKKAFVTVDCNILLSKLQFYEMVLFLLETSCANLSNKLPQIIRATSSMWCSTRNYYFILVIHQRSA